MATPYQFVKRGNLFIVPVGPSIAEPPPPTQSFTKPPDYSLWVHGRIQEPGLQLDRARMTPRLYQEVRDDLARYATVEVTRSAIRRSSHAYVGVIDSRGTPYYFALDSRGLSLREADDSAWKAFDRLADDELKAAVQQRRADAAGEMRRVDRELSAPLLVVTKGLRYGRKIDWRHDAPGSSWWKRNRTKKPKEPAAADDDGSEQTEKADARVAAATVGRRDRPGGLRGPGREVNPHAYKQKRAEHEAAGGIAVGRTRIRPSHGNEAKPAAEPPHYERRPDHVIGGPGHRVAGEPEHEKPRGTTSLWHPGDDARRVRMAERERKNAPPKRTHAEQLAHDRQLSARHAASDVRARARNERAAVQHREYDDDRTAHEAHGGIAIGHSRVRGEPKKRSWLRRLFGKGDAVLVALPTCRVVGRGSPGRLYASEMRRVGAELAEQLGEEDLDPPREDDVVVDPPRVGEVLLVAKALPRGGKEDKVKRAPSGKASSKKAGAGGKTRYSYPREKGTQARQPAVPLVVVHDDTKHADPAELANQLGVSVRTLQRTARSLGSDGFTSFMRSRLKRFAAKHRLDPDYWGTLYSNLVAAPGGEVAKSDDASRKFGDDVNRVASSVPPDHKERFGDRKVFIHHVHHEMKRHGLFSGDLKDFKERVVRAHKNGHVEASRADLVSAMDHHSVSQSETKADGATFHFIANAKHDPEASKKLSVARKPEKKPGDGPLHDAARSASQRASAATAHAQKTNKPEDHLAAMTAHHQAGVAHQRATGKVGHKAALRHFDQSMAHLSASKAKD